MRPITGPIYHVRGCLGGAVRMRVELACFQALAAGLCGYGCLVGAASQRASSKLSFCLCSCLYSFCTSVEMGKGIVDSVYSTSCKVEVVIGSFMRSARSGLVRFLFGFRTQKKC